MTRRDRDSSHRSHAPRGGEQEPALPPQEEACTQEDTEDEAPPAWLQAASARHEQRQRQYASLFDRARDAVEKEKEGLSGFLQRVGEAEGPAEEEAPSSNLFQDASQEWQERQRSLGGIFGEALRSRQQESEALKKMFERPPRKGGRR